MKLPQVGSYIHDLTRSGYTIMRVGEISREVAIAAVIAAHPDTPAPQYLANNGLVNKYWVRISPLGIQEEQDFAIAVYNHDGRHYLYTINKENHHA